MERNVQFTLALTSLLFSSHENSSLLMRQHSLVYPIALNKQLIVCNRGKWEHTCFGPIVANCMIKNQIYAQRQAKLKKKKIYGYSCGSNISNLPLEHDDIYFDNIRNAKYFRNWLTAFNPELQTFGVEALKYLEKNKKLPFLVNNKKQKFTSIFPCFSHTHFYRIFTHGLNALLPYIPNQSISPK